ncbi:Catenin alpha-2 [Anabarilius grahami]|uniref:Catenin alpha-2 n=1 Tax=Anabarilius grahami TaxID=495550 RepID=A0A3N0XJM6_ANAGA|nr:Catenin alpha-2 [Anabarilius grahami]
MTSILEDGLIKTSSIEQVVAPLSTHLCHLILLCGSETELDEFIRLEAAAKAVAKASKNMAAVATRLVADTEDEILKMEMDPLVESLTVSGQHVLLATQKLSIQPEVIDHREELIEATQNVLLGVVKILLVEDDATIRKITAATDWLLQCLSQVGAAANISSLLKAFQVYSKAMLLLHNLVVERIQELRDGKQQEHLRASLETLKKCVSMLHTAMYTTIKHPHSEEAQGAKQYILNQVDSTVNDIITTLKSNCEPSATGSCGYYTEIQNKILRLLSDPASVKDGGFDVMLRDLVFYSMAVANTSLRDIQFEVAAHSKQVLQHWSEMSQQMKCCDDQQLAKSCASLLEQIHKLEDAVVKATQLQVMNIFVTSSTPLEHLVHTVNYSFQDGQDDNELDVETLRVQLESFRAHADKISEVAGFISALAFNEKSLEGVENSRGCIMRLKQAIAALVQNFEEDKVRSSEALEKLKEMHQRWSEEMEQLLHACSSIINVKDFVCLALHEMESSFKGCIEAHKDEDAQFLTKQASLLIGHMSLVIQLVKRHVSKSDNPIYRNGLLVLIKQAEGSAAEVTSCVTDLYSQTSLSNEAFSLFSTSVSAALKHFEILREGLDGLQHPHLLSPLREGARQSAGTVPCATPISEHERSTADSDKTESSVRSSTSEEIPCQLEDGLENQAVQTIMAHDVPITEEAWIAPVVESKAVVQLHNLELLPLLCEVVCMTKGKDVEALNMACTGVLGLSNSYAQATREATSVIDTADNEEMESLRSKLVSLTPLLVQTAQETAMSSARGTDSIYKHSTQFSDLIKNARKILLPVTGMWYHAVYSMFQNYVPNMLESITQELTEVMCLCADAVQLVTSADIKLIGGCHESIGSLQSKLQKAQTNTKNLTDIVGSRPTRTDELDGLCMLWALSVQVLLNSLDKMLGTATTDGKGHLITHQMTPKKWLAVMSENSLRIQEAARLSSLNCRDSYKLKLLGELQEDVKTLTDSYLQAAEGVSTVSLSSVLILAKSELLQRQLQIKMKALSCLLSKINQDYQTAIQNTIALACSVQAKDSDMETEDKLAQFESAAELLMQNVKSATESIQDCFNYIRDPKERSNLRFINDHLTFQMSDIVSRARLIAETQSLGDTLTLDIQSQCWPAKAHYLVEELSKVDGILVLTKEQIMCALQGKESSGFVISQTPISFTQKTTLLPISTSTQGPIKSKPSTGVLDVSNQEPNKEETSQRSPRGPVFTLVDTTLSYTSLFLKWETEKWDDKGNQIVKVTKEMADKLYHMAQYLKKKGPIQTKDAFVTSAKDLISSGQSITQFVRVIADHCLDKHCTDELCVIAEQILTISNQLTIISSVNAVTPGCKSSDEILVKNAQNLLQTVIQGVRAAEAACIRGLKQPEPNSEAARAAAFCFQWKKSLLIHRAQEQLNPETDDLGLRRTSQHSAAPSLAPPINVLDNYKRVNTK